MLITLINWNKLQSICIYQNIKSINKNEYTDNKQIDKKYYYTIKTFL